MQLTNCIIMTAADLYPTVVVIRLWRYPGTYLSIRTATAEFITYFPYCHYCSWHSKSYPNTQSNLISSTQPAIPPSTPGCVTKIIMAMMPHPFNSHLPDVGTGLPWPFVVADGVCKGVVGILVYGVTKAGAAVWLHCAHHVDATDVASAKSCTMLHDAMAQFAIAWMARL
jgi:hypothetical protein